MIGSNILAPAALLLGIGLAASVWGNLRQAESLGAERQALADAVALAEHNATQALALSAAWMESDERLARQMGREAARLKTLNKRLEEIRRAPATDDGPVAPVLHSTLERLYQFAVGAPAGGGGNPRR